MWCCKCNHDLTQCVCSDIDERLERLSMSPHLALRWCLKCNRHADRCICIPEDDHQSLGGFDDRR